MRLVVAGHKTRGAACLRALLDAGHVVAGVIGQPGAAPDRDPFLLLAFERQLPVVSGEVNAPSTIASIGALGPELIVLAGFGPIVGESFLAIAPHGCINLHAGRLPQYRGSSPLNWALINGEASFTVSVIRVDRGVDTGPVLAERTSPVGPDDTIADLHRVANDVFPQLLVQVVADIAAGSVRGRVQDECDAAYYPLRFPDDGLVVWDGLTALQVHNRIRALTTPYPGAFTYFGGRRVQLLRSRMTKRTYFGEPGRVYLRSERALLVCAADRCLWIVEASMADDGSDAATAVRRYDKFLTLRDQAVALAMTRFQDAHRIA
ncbi:MAG: methionyl-tRNA formyltransferase [Vicinamibacterales bacterium]